MSFYYLNQHWPTSNCCQLLISYGRHEIKIDPICYLVVSGLIECFIPIKIILLNLIRNTETIWFEKGWIWIQMSYECVLCWLCPDQCTFEIQMVLETRFSHFLAEGNIVKPQQTCIWKRWPLTWTSGVVVLVEVVL